MRHMTGDKNYVPGDVRELNDQEAAPLLASGAIKMMRAPENKMQKPLTLNKGVK